MTSPWNSLQSFFGNLPTFPPSGVQSRTFEDYYQCFSSPFASKPDIDKGNKILLPPEALRKLATLDVQWPMLFELSNASQQRKTHCGVLEFSAEHQKCHMPYWMMQNLLLDEGDMVAVRNATLPKGTFVKLQPVTSTFLQVSNPRAVLESALRYFACLTVGDVIQIRYNDDIYEIEIIEARPANAISIIEVDVEVDFAPPKDYIEPPTPPVKAETSQGVESPPSDQEDEEDAKFTLFGGGGRVLDDSHVRSTTTEEGGVTEEPWRNAIPGGVRTECARYAELVRRGRIKRPLALKEKNLFKGAGQRLD